MLLARFMRAYPAYRHDHILRMPWRTFVALLDEISAHERRQADARYFRNTSLQAEWEENQEEWLRLQAPSDRSTNEDRTAP